MIQTFAGDIFPSMPYGRIRFLCWLVIICFKGLIFSLENDDYNLLKIVSNAVREMSEGELLQIEKARRLDILKISILRSSGKKLLPSLLPAVPVEVLLQALIRKQLKRCVFSENIRGLRSRSKTIF
jgi:hypothetical protein